MITSSIVEELHTLRDVIRWTSSYFNSSDLFYGHCNADARLTQAEKQHLATINTAACGGSCTGPLPY